MTTEATSTALQPGEHCQRHDAHDTCDHPEGATLWLGGDAWAHPKGDDVASAARVCNWLGLSPAAVWLHPAGNTLAAQFIAIRKCHDTAREHGFRLTPLITPMLEGDPR